MNKFDLKKILPHLIAVAIFAVVAIIYCKPALQGRVVQQHDTQGWRGMSQQSVEFREKYGYFPLWTNSMFSGMPAYQIAFDAKTPIQIAYVYPFLTLGLPIPINFFFLACICFYFLCIVAGVRPWVSILGAIAYSYVTFNAVIIAVGHNTQMMSLALAPAVIAGLFLLFKKRYWAGFAVTTFFASLLIGQSHLQMVYYTLILIAFLLVAFLIKSYKDKNISHGIRSFAVAVVAGLLGLASNAVTMMPTYEYAKESIRGGKSELTLGKDKKIKTEGGLDKDYAFAYSVGIAETFTLISPGVYGGSNGGREHASTSKFAEKLSEAGVPEDNAVQMANGYSYWGRQQPTSGPAYVGAVICFLFIFAMVYLKGWHRWWLIPASFFGILLAWGKNFEAFNYFLFDHLPFYNKFRAPAWGLVLTQFCFPFGAVLGINRLLGETDWNEAWKKLRVSVMITGVILFLLCAFYFTASFTGPKDKDMKEQFRLSMLQQSPAGQPPPQQLSQQADQFSRELVSALQADRKNLMGGDFLRTIFLIALAISLTGLFIRKKIKPWILIAGLTILSTYDLLAIDARYLGEDNFIETSDFESVFTPTEADLQILKDPEHASVRVFNSSVDVFNDATTSYHHNSVGGYHPAKLALYQDVIANQLSKGNMEVFNMLNTKYFINTNPVTGRPAAQLNPAAFGNCWLVKGIKYVNNADGEMLALDNTDLRDTAVIDRSFSPFVKTQPQYDSAAAIKLKENMNDKITYEYNSLTPQFAVFSEVYYSRGWNAYIDGQKSPYVKVNYILRGMPLPAGKHEVEFRFEPASFTRGRTITIWSNVLLMLTVVIALFLYLRPGKRPDEHIL